MAIFLAPKRWMLMTLHPQHKWKWNVRGVHAISITHGKNCKRNTCSYVDNQKWVETKLHSTNKNKAKQTNARQIMPNTALQNTATTERKSTKLIPTKVNRKSQCIYASPAGVSPQPDRPSQPKKIIQTTPCWPSRHTTLPTASPQHNTAVVLVVTIDQGWAGLCDSKILARSHLAKSHLAGVT